MHQTEPSIIADPGAAAEGALRIAWARENMPLLEALRGEFERELPLAGRRIGACMHVRAKTAVLVRVLRAGGADVVLTGSPATTDDAVAAALAREPAMRVYARGDDTLADHERHVERILAAQPDILVDNGADLVTACLAAGGSPVVAATEETTSGATRLRGDLAGRVDFPVIVVNDSPLKLLLENQHGVGPTVVEGFVRATNLLVAASTFAVIGYGWCGRGIARSLRALGASVLVVELDVVRALEAAFDGMRITDLASAVKRADAIVTATGCTRVIGRDELLAVRDGALVANAGHFGSEIDVAALEALAIRSRPLTRHVVEYELPNGRRVRLLGGGEMLNLTAAAGNPIQVMDVGYALQAHALRSLAVSPANFAPGPQPVPDAINRRVGLDFLRTLSVVDPDSHAWLGRDTGRRISKMDCD